MMSNYLTVKLLKLSPIRYEWKEPALARSISQVIIYAINCKVLCFVILPNLFFLVK